MVPTYSGLFRIDKQNGNVLELLQGGSLPVGGIVELANFSENTRSAWSLELEQSVLKIPYSAKMKVCGDLIFYKNENVTGAVDKSGNPVWESQESYFPEYCPTDQQGYLLSPYGLEAIEFTSKNFYARTNNSELAAVDKQSGKVNWVGYNKDFKWLGEVDGKVIYSHEGFGLTQALEANNHQLAWENSGLVMDRLVGITGKTIIGLTNISFGSTIVGINIENGNQIWSQPGEDPLIVGDNLIVTNDSTITFVDPQSGNT
ncbi:PQQ-like beta-propeller repeat protein, partial [bacterium]|nr:PQQ-like beta-propeller repeat protein [bacterium]